MNVASSKVSSLCSTVQLSGTFVPAAVVQRRVWQAPEGVAAAFLIKVRRAFLERALERMPERAESGAWSPKVVAKQGFQAIRASVSRLTTAAGTGRVVKAPSCMKRDTGEGTAAWAVCCRKHKQDRDMSAHREIKIPIFLPCTPPELYGVSARQIYIRQYRWHHNAKISVSPERRTGESSGSLSLLATARSGKPFTAATLKKPFYGQRLCCFCCARI